MLKKYKQEIEKDKFELVKKAVEIIEKDKMTDTINKIVSTYLYGFKELPQYKYSILFQTNTEIVELKFKNLLNNTISWDFIKNDLEKIYDELYNEDELIKMIDFYSTELGKKIINTQDIINDKKMNFVNKVLHKYQDEINNLFENIKTFPFDN